MRSLRTRAAHASTAIAAIGVSMALAVVPALSQPKPVPNNPSPRPPPDAVDFILDALETCGEAIDNDFDTAADNLTDAGWDLDDPFDNGPYLEEIAGTKDYGAPGIAYYYAALERYPEAALGYCEYEVDVPGIPIDLNALAADYAFVGNVETGGEGMFGAWTIVDSGVTYYVLAYVNPDIYHLQVTWFLED